VPDASTAKTDAPTDLDPAPLRPFTDWEGNDDVERGSARDQGARSRRTATVEKLFADAGVSFPATQVLFRVFKKEHKLEVWANDAKGAAMKPIATYGICRISGDVGPKRHEGDRQVPEGFYEIPGMWTDTPYHLALDVNYPNPYDRAQTPNSPGSAILVHGSCVSIGCISMSDERIEELWTIAAPLYRHGETVKLHIFPSRNMKELMANPEEAEHVAFWRLIEPTLDKFNDDHVLATVTFDWKRDYVVNGTPLR
jgi:murein L,D-transpeptidase YafK